MQNHGDEPVYVISVAARLAGLPCWVLRVLDQEGIVVPVRTDSNRRLYSDNDLVVLTRVRYLTEERGVNIAGVKVILEMEQAHELARARDSADKNSFAPPANGRGTPIIPSRSADPPAADRTEGTPHDLPVRRPD